MQTSSIRSLKHKITEDGKPLRPKHVVFDHITYNKHQQAAGKNFPKSRSFPLQAKQTHWGGTGESFTYTRLRPPKGGGGGCSAPRPGRFTLGKCTILLKILGTRRDT